MEMQIESSKFVTNLDGVPVRVWYGTTKDGTECKVFVHRIAVKKEADCEQFEKELSEQLPPSSHMPLSYFID